MSIVKAYLKKRNLARKKPDIWFVDDKKFGFILLRKVASRSFKGVLAKYTHEKQHGPIEGFLDLKQERQLDKASCEHIKTSKLYKMRKNVFLATFVRNPFSRLLSCYIDKIVQREDGVVSDVIAYGIHYDMSFEEFAKQVAKIPDAMSNTHFRSMSAFLLHKDKVIPHFVGKFENMAEDWPKLQEKIDLPSLPHRKKSGEYKKDEYKEHYTKELANIVYERYKKDVDTFGYYDDIKDML